MAVLRNSEVIAETFLLRGEYTQSNPDMANPQDTATLTLHS